MADHSESYMICLWSAQEMFVSDTVKWQIILKVIWFVISSGNVCKWHSEVADHSESYMICLWSAQENMVCDVLESNADSTDCTNVDIWKMFCKFRESAWQKGKL